MRLLSADGHIDLFFIADDIFHDAAPAALKDRVPRCVSPARWEHKGKVLYQSVMTDRSNVPDSAVVRRMLPTGVFDNVGVKGLSRSATPERRIEDQDRDGVEGDVIYGLLGLDAYMSDDIEAFRSCLVAYYKWAQGFAAAAPNRFAMLAPISGQDPVQAAEDVHMVAELGLKGVELRPRTAVKPFWHDDWEPLWKAIVDTGLPVHIHSDALRLREAYTVPADDPRASHYVEVTKAVVASIGKMANAEHLGTMILSGVLERHPSMTFVLGECDLSWIPHFLNRMDYCVTEREHSTGLPLLPSEYWQRQCKATFQTDKLGVEMVKLLGIDNIMWGNDYPHPDGIWPSSQRTNAEQGSALTPEERQKVFYTNAASMYGIGDQTLTMQLSEAIAG